MSSNRPSTPARAIARRVASLAAIAFASVGPALAADYNMVDLGTLDQSTVAVVRGLNLGGTVVGGGRLVGRSAGAREGLVFDRGSTQGVPGLPGSQNTNVFGINDQGTLAGAANGDTAIRGFVGPRTGPTRELPPLPGDTGSAAFAINNAGQAVGFSSGPAGERAVAWSAAGEPAALPSPAGETARAYGINQRGDVTGVVGTSTARRATLWPIAAAARSLPPLQNFGASEAASINAAASVVGYSATADEARRATLWPATGAPVDLGVLPGMAVSQAFGINDAGQVVGMSAGDVGARAFLWTATTGLRDLNTLIDPTGVVLTQAVAINNAGMIAAIGHDPVPGNDPHIHAHELPMRIFLLVRSGG
ncbi:MAG: hypothetical protein ACXWC2_09250 [Ramlibacter sp.]